jgi:hypothetical protein
VTQLSWDNVGQRFYETGVDRGVLYVDGVGVAWNGLTAVEEAPTGAEARPLYVDGIKYLNLASREEFAATINAFYSPVEFDVCEGYGQVALGLVAGQQRRKPFAFCYRTKIGSDLDPDHGYKIHIVYNAMVAPATRSYASLSDSHDVPVLSWPITTTPVVIPGMMRSAQLVIDSTKISALGLSEIEKILYGTDTTGPTLPSPEDIIAALTTADEFVVTDLGGGMFEISGSVSNIIEASPGIYQIVHDTAVVDIDADSSEIHSA